VREQHRSLILRTRSSTALAHARPSDASVSLLPDRRTDTFDQNYASHAWESLHIV